MNIDSIRILSFDLDGTLLNNRKEISSYSIEIITRLQKQGYQIILNSGRFYHEMEDYIKQLNMKEYGGYVICSNGCVAYDIKAQKKITFSMLPYQDGASLYQIAKQSRLTTYVYFNEAYHLYATFFLRLLFRLGKALTLLCYPFLPSKLKHLSTRILHQRIEPYTKLEAIPSIEKMCFLGLPPQLSSFWKRVVKQHPDLHYFEVNAFGIEIVHESVSKAEAVKYICEQNQLSMANVLAFGDSGNDLPLLTQAGIGVVMKNAKEIVKHCTPYTTAYTNKQDGVCRFLEVYIFDGKQEL